MTAGNTVFCPTPFYPVRVEVSTKSETDEPYRMHCVTKAGAAGCWKYDLNFDEIQLRFFSMNQAQWPKLFNCNVMTSWFPNAICVDEFANLATYWTVCGPFDTCVHSRNWSLFYPRSPKVFPSSWILTRICFILWISYNLFPERWDWRVFSEKVCCQIKVRFWVEMTSQFFVFPIQGLCNLSRASGLSQTLLRVALGPMTLMTMMTMMILMILIAMILRYLVMKVN